MNSDAELRAAARESEGLRAEVAALRKDVAAILRGVALLARHLGAVAPKPGAAGGRIAGDAELDGRYGDGKVFLNPRAWGGESFKGSRMSECPPDFLDLLAAVLDEFADAEADAKKQKYKRDDAARARGWAKRKRAAAPAEDL